MKHCRSAVFLIMAAFLIASVLPVSAALSGETGQTIMRISMLTPRRGI